MAARLAIYRPPRRSRRALALSAVLGTGLALGWAASVTFEPPADLPVADSFALVTVASGTVGSDITLNTSAKWTPQPAGYNRAQGIVTSVDVEAGTEVSTGAPVYSVDLRPVFVAEGATPMFRTISTDAKGADVLQLQRLLAATGTFAGTPDGEFGSKTVAAVKAWQKSTGQTVDGIVRLSDLIFIPTLPARITVDTDFVSSGKALVGGELVVNTLSASPDFHIVATAQQAAMMPDGTRVEVASPSGDQWLGIARGQTADENAGVTVQILSKDGLAICALACGEISIEGETLLSSRVVTVQSETGLIVPSSAIHSANDGSTYLVDASGQRLDITVGQSARGMSIVEGVEVGVTVQIPTASE